jgi:hypothetical protein
MANEVLYKTNILIAPRALEMLLGSATLRRAAREEGVQRSTSFAGCWQGKGEYRWASA